MWIFLIGGSARAQTQDSKAQLEELQNRVKILTEQLSLLTAQLNLDAATKSLELNMQRGKANRYFITFSIILFYGPSDQQII
jgi:hypothetical protein